MVAWLRKNIKDESLKKYLCPTIFMNIFAGHFAKWMREREAWDVTLFFFTIKHLELSPFNKLRPFNNTDKKTKPN